MIVLHGAGFSYIGYGNWSTRIETALNQLWKSEDHHLRDIKPTLQLCWQLVNKNCDEAPPRKKSSQWAKFVVSADVHLESAYALSVKHLLDAYIELEQVSGAAETMTQSGADKLWILSVLWRTDDRNWLPWFDEFGQKFLSKLLPCQTVTGAYFEI